MQLTDNEKGFGLIETLLVVLIILILGLCGFYIYHTEHQTKVPTTISNVSKNIDDNSAKQLVKAFYDKYNSTVADGNAFLNVVEQYGTSKLVAYYDKYRTSGEDPIVCAQATPTNMTLSTQSDTSFSDNLVVTESFGQSSQSLVVSVVKDANNLKIDSVTCPQPLTTGGEGP